VPSVEVTRTALVTWPAVMTSERMIAFSAPPVMMIPSPLRLTTAASRICSPAVPLTLMPGALPVGWLIATFSSYDGAPGALPLKVIVPLIATPGAPVIVTPGALNVAASYVPGATLNTSPAAAAAAASVSEPHARSAGAPQAPLDADTV
jgi:hypothetical protein